MLSHCANSLIPERIIYE